MDDITLENLLASDMSAAEHLLKESLCSDIDLIKNQLCHYLIDREDKRLRLQIILLATYVLGYQGNKHFNLVVIIEFIHAAFKFHDNIDKPCKSSTVFRHKAPRILVGDFLFSRAVSMMHDLDKIRLMEILFYAINQTSQGKMLRLSHTKNPKITCEQYYKLIQSEVAILFEASTLLSAVICNTSKKNEHALQNYGHHLGISLQLINEILCFDQDSENIKTGLSLPLVRAMQVGAPALRKALEEAIHNNETFHVIRNLILETDAIEYTKKLAYKESQKAISALCVLPESSYREKLANISSF